MLEVHAIELTVLICICCRISQETQQHFASDNNHSDRSMMRTPLVALRSDFGGKTGTPPWIPREGRAALQNPAPVRGKLALRVASVYTRSGAGGHPEPRPAGYDGCSRSTVGAKQRAADPGTWNHRRKGNTKKYLTGPRVSTRYGAGNGHGRGRGRSQTPDGLKAHSGCRRRGPPWLGGCRERRFRSPDCRVAGCRVTLPADAARRPADEGRKRVRVSLAYLGAPLEFSGLRRRAVDPVGKARIKTCKRVEVGGSG